jgi:hypothetical protein
MLFATSGLLRSPRRSSDSVCVACDKNDAATAGLLRSPRRSSDSVMAVVLVSTSSQRCYTCRLLRFDACSPVSVRRSKQQSSVCGHLIQLILICGKIRYRFKTDSGVLRDGVDARL